VTWAISGWKPVKVMNLNEGLQGRKVVIEIEEGMGYLHKLRIMPLISIKTPPQIAVWIEDVDGSYIQTLYASEKIVSGSWKKAPADKEAGEAVTRAEALPYWSYKKSQDTADSASGATPKRSSVINTAAAMDKGVYYIMAEVNSSADFNDYFPENANPGDWNYSGGKFGSGQPALVYKVLVDFEKPGTYVFSLAGHSSPDGSDGSLYEDISSITTAMEIMKKMAIVIN
jgi:hypothetical protein